MDERLKRISETLHNIADEAYNEGFEKGSANAYDCSWEKGVRDAWEYVEKNVNEILKDRDITWLETAKRVKRFFTDLDPVSYTKDYVEERNKRDLAETEPIEVRDYVIDKSGRELLVTCIKGDVVYAIDRTGAHLYLYAMSDLTKTGKKVRVRAEKEYRVKEERM